MEVHTQVAYDHIIVHHRVARKGTAFLSVKSIHFVIELAVGAEVQVASGGFLQGWQVVRKLAYQLRGNGSVSVLTKNDTLRIT